MMQNEVVVKDVLHSTERKKLTKHVFQSLVVLMRISFGIGWLLAGVTKILGEAGSSGHSWFAQPGVFLNDYLMKALDKPNVPDFYKYFIEGAALKHVTFFNYTIPIVQVMVGLFLIVGFMTLPSILTCLFMHINFLLSGNINLISITLYTSAFSLLLSRRQVYSLSLDQYFKLDNIFNLRTNKSRDITINTLKETFPQDDLKKLLQDGINDIAKSVEKAQVSQNERIEQFITYVQETYYNENNHVEKKII
ncbi:TQO small subunit DoxD [Ectobacillus panaciterrae]|uniref:TQO small subunit DoxD n=1 Tax=Ectobacillus panaciterrae TaxID=363872 RepID=UPI00041135F3|nr:TQO small subunit DoxD [Ectobacillus panaciterrae]